MALAVILIVVFGVIYMTIRKPNAPLASATLASAGAGRGCGCGGNVYRHHDDHHDKHYRHHDHHKYDSSTSSNSYPVPPVPHNATVAYLRLAHAAPDVKTPLLITVDGVPVFDNIVPGSVTKYVPVEKTSVTLGLISNGVQVASVPVTLPVLGSSSQAPLFTIAAVPAESPLRGVPPISVKTIADPVIQTASDSEAGVRFYHLSPTAPNVDIYANSQRVFSNVAYGTEVFAAVPAGKYSVAVVPAGKPLTESTIVYRNDSVTVQPNTVLSIFAEGTDKLSVVTATTKL